MKKFNIFTVFFIVVVMLAAQLSSGFATNDPGVMADSALLVESTTGKILYEKNRDVRVSAGNVAKLMTVLVAVEAIEKGQVSLLDNVTATDTFLNGLGDNAVVQNIVPGEKLKLEDLLYCAAIASAGDACNVIAEYIYGSKEAFIDAMNQKAAKLGCKDTHFVNATGVDDPNQYTTPWDLFLIMNEASRHRLFLEISSATTFQTRPTEYSSGRSLKNTNLMLHRNSDCFYPYSRVGMSAETKQNGSSYAGFAKKDKLSLIAIVVGASGTDLNGEQAVNAGCAESKLLFEWAFSSFTWQTIVNKNEIVAQSSIRLASGTETIDIAPTEAITVLARKDLKQSDIVKDIFLYSDTNGEELTAPVSRGEPLGEMIITIDGAFCGRIGLIAADDVRLDYAAYIREHLTDTFNDSWVVVIIILIILLVSIYIWLIGREYKARRKKRQQLEEIKHKIVEEREHSIYK